MPNEDNLPLDELMSLVTHNQTPVRKNYVEEPQAEYYSLFQQDVPFPAPENPKFTFTTDAIIFKVFL